MAQLVVNFEFTMEDADKLIAARSEDRPGVLDEILLHKSPQPRESSFNVDETLKAIGEAMVNHRERELKMLAAPAETESE